MGRTRITIGGETYTEQDIQDGKRLDNPAVNPAGSSVNVSVTSGSNTGIQAGSIAGDITVTRD